MKRTLTGFAKRPSLKAAVISKPVRPQVIVETDAQINERIRNKFTSLDQLAETVAKGLDRSLIVSGPPGLGKSHGVEAVLAKLDKDKFTVAVVSGYVRATGLYQTLYENRHANSVVLIDDADTVFSDETSLNLLKKASDMTSTRIISYLAETKMDVPRTFEFKGSIIFITNLKLHEMAESTSKLAEHCKALISRSHYLDLGMNSRRDYMVRVKQVIDGGMLRKLDCSTSTEQMIVCFMEDNLDCLREVSLRMVIKIASLMKSNPQSWVSLAVATCCK